jgi:hypothetical protein
VEVERNKYVPDGKLLIVDTIDGEHLFAAGAPVTQEELDGGDLVDLDPVVEVDGEG